MNKCKISIWGRDFDLPVCYDCLPGEEAIDNQKKALSLFVSSPQIINESLKTVESKIMNNNTEVGILIDNIFKYVMPKSIYIPRSNEQRSVAILCDYKFDPEHGLALVFENEKFKFTGEQDTVL